MVRTRVEVDLGRNRKSGPSKPELGYWTGATGSTSVIEWAAQEPEGGLLQ
jgi:hypothetical protein